MTYKKGLIVFLAITVLFGIGAMNVSAKGFGGRSTTGQNRRMMPGMMGHRGYVREDVDSVFEENQKALDDLVDEYAEAGKLTASEAELLKVTGYQQAQSRQTVIEKLVSDGDLERREWAILQGLRVRDEEDQDREALLETLVAEGTLNADEAELFSKAPYEVMEERDDLIEHLVESGKLSEEEAEKLQTVCKEEGRRFKRTFDVGRGRFGGPCFSSESPDAETDVADD